MAQVRIEPFLVIAFEQPDLPVPQPIAAPSYLDGLDRRATVEEIDGASDEHLPLLGLPRTIARRCSYSRKPIGFDAQGSTIDPETHSDFTFGLVAGPAKGLKIVKLVRAPPIEGANMIRLEISSAAAA